MSLATADLCDQYTDLVQVALPIFNDYGGKKQFHGPASTVSVFEDNSLVRAALEEPGDGRVLIVDGGESLNCALVGDLLAQLGRDNGWEGIIVSGCIRDSAAIAGINIGIKALNTNPRKSVKKGAGDRDIPVTIAGVTFIPGAYIYADEDGILISHQPLS
jgi:regulator of ribonuclease activity A